MDKHKPLIGNNFEAVVNYLVDVKKEYASKNLFAKAHGTSRQNLDSMFSLKTASGKLIDVCSSANISLNYLCMNRGSMFLEDVKDNLKVAFVESAYDLKKAFEDSSKIEKLPFSFPKEISDTIFKNQEDSKEIIAFYHQPHQKIYFVVDEKEFTKVEGTYVIKYNANYIDFGTILPSLKTNDSYIIKTDNETINKIEFESNKDSEVVAHVLCSMDILINS